MSVSGLHWFCNDGGPLIVLPENPRPLWEGTEPPSAGRVVNARFRFDDEVATDYDRACDVEEPAELLVQDGGWVLILGGVVQRAAWLRISDDCFLVVSEDWLPDDSDVALRARYEAMTDYPWFLVKHDVQIGPGGLVLTHAGSTLSDAALSSFDEMPKRGYSVIGDGIRYPVAPGTYRIEAESIKASDAALLADFRGSFVRFLKT
jgi:hypothetical protein